MHYEWDETKRSINLRKHGVDLADAVGVLDDPAGLTVDDDADGESRCVTLVRWVAISPGEFCTWCGHCAMMTPFA